MTLYLVIQSAVYRHGIGGVFTTLDGAKACADQLAATDIDNHHQYSVLPIEADVAVAEEPDEVYVTQKGEPPRTNFDGMYPII